jgi:hypothetical protein
MVNKTSFGKHWKNSLKTIKKRILTRRKNCHPWVSEETKNKISTTRKERIKLGIIQRPIGKLNEII